MPRVFKDAMISVGALALLLLALVSVDSRLREYATDVLTTPPSQGELARVGHQVENVSTVVYKAARDKSIEHSAMVIFGVAASVLLVFMLRT
jgi:hypothetical protein